MKPKPLSVLLIDDDPEMANLLQIILDYHNIHLEVADTAQNGLEYLTKNVPDLIVVDLILPDLDGYHVLGHIRENPATQNAKVILTTTYFGNSTKDTVLRYGFDGFLPKPITALSVVPYLENIALGRVN